MADSLPETSPAGQGVKAFLENFAAIAGAVTIAILAMSVSHEYGYFWSIGRQFQAFLTTADYLSNGVIWLPFGLLFVYQWVEWSRFKETGPPRIDWKKWHDVAWLAAGVIIFGYSAANLTWPLTWNGAVNVVIIVVYIWSYIWRAFLPRAVLEEPFKFIITHLIRFGVPLIAAMFFYGSVDAERDLARFDQPYGVRFKDEAGIQLRIFLRSFDKGVLLRNATDKTIEFRKWDDVVSINKHIPDKSGPPICWLFGWECGSRNIAGPL
jgi:hypothetical protein